MVILIDFIIGKQGNRLSTFYVKATETVDDEEQEFS